MKAEVDFTNCSSGELSPKAKARIDIGKYFNGADTQLNLVTLPLGGVTRRPGTVFVLPCKDQANKAELVPFIFSTIQAYQLEFSNGNIRVFMNDAVVLSGSNPVDIPSPYGTADLALLQFTQSADTLYIYHPTIKSRTLTRSSHTSWTLSSIVFRDGPYLSVNTTATTITPSGTSGAITLTASSIVGINASPQSTGQGFLATDVGRLVRVKVSALWGWCLITGRTSTTVVSAIVQDAVNGGAAGTLDGTTATISWQLGKWSDTTGYPYVPTFWQQRLMSCGTNNQPNAIEGSNTGDFTNMAPTGSDGTVTATNALDWIISDDQVNAIRWVSAAGSAQAAQLGIGTTGGEDIMQAATTTQALTPTSVQVYRETAYGSAANVNTLRIGKSVLFANRPGRKIHEWTFQWQVNGYLGPDLTVLSEHITRGGIVQMAYQQSPYGVVWCLLATGALIALTYLREQDVVAWHRHQLGGEYYGGPPIVESISVTPSPDGSYDELWLTVLRTIAGVPTRFVEVMGPYFDGQPAEEAVFMDAAVTSGLTFPAATLTPSAMDGAGVTFAASANVFTSGSVGSLIRLNGGIAVVRAYTDAEHVVGDWYEPAVNLAPAAANAWSCTAQLTTFSGVGHLTGEVVQIIGDGADFGTQTVAGSNIVLASGKASLVSAGLPTEYDFVAMPFEPQRATAFAAQGRVKSIDHLYLRLHESLGCNFGRRRKDPETDAVEDMLEALETRSAGDMMGQAPPLFSGIRRLTVPGGYDQECQLKVSGSGPMPFTMLGFGALAEIGDLPTGQG